MLSYEKIVNTDNDIIWLTIYITSNFALSQIKLIIHMKEVELASLRGTDKKNGNQHFPYGEDIAILKRNLDYYMLG